MDNKVNRVGAQSAAIAGLRPIQNGDNKLSFAMGYGHYEGRNALALGAFYAPTDKVNFNLSSSFEANGDGASMVSAGVSFALDAKSPAKKAKEELAKTLDTLDEAEIKMLCQAIKELKER